jgi:hypothetical protein
MGLMSDTVCDCNCELKQVYRIDSLDNGRAGRLGVSFIYARSKKRHWLTGSIASSLCNVLLKNPKADDALLLNR